MPKAGLFAGEATESAPIDGALTTKQKGYHWMQWDAVPDRASAEFGDGKGYAATQNNYIAGVDYPHPFEGQEFSEFTISMVFKSNTEPTFAVNEQEPCGLNSPGGFALRYYSGFGSQNIDASIYSQPNGASNLRIGGGALRLESTGTAGWSPLHWYCITISYSQPLNLMVVAYVNMSLGQEVAQTLTVASNTNVSYTGATSGGFASVASYGMKSVSAPDVLVRPWKGSIGHVLIHNGYVDVTQVGGRRLFSGIDGIIALGKNGQNPFGETPLIYMPSGGPWDNRGTANVGNYPADFVLAEPLSLDQNLPPVAS